MFYWLKMSKEKTKKTAYHEAAHAFAAWCYGEKIQLVTLVGPVKELKDPRPYYCLSIRIETCDGRKMEHEEVLNHIASSLAPAAFELDFFGKISCSGLLHAKQAIEELVWQDPEVQKISDFAGRISNHSETWEDAALKFFKEYSAPVKKLVCSPLSLKVIEGLGDLLLKRGKLTGFETVTFLEKNWKGQMPEKALPAENHSMGVGEQSLKGRIDAASRLVKMAMGILQEHRPQDKQEEETIETAVKSMLTSIFSLEELKAGIDL